MNATDLSIVLVHAAWLDGSSWAPVTARLARRGFRVLAAPLPLSSLEDDASAIAATVRRAQAPSLVVGHAYAGGPMSVTTPDGIAGLVYVAGLAPDEGESVAEVYGRHPHHELAPALTPAADGLLYLPREAFARAFAQNADADVLRNLEAAQRPIAPKAITTPSPAPLWKRLPSWYLIATQDRMIPTATQRFVARRMDAVVSEAPTDHVPMLTSPDTVADLIEQAARTLVASATRA
ncbi:alpha/beta hydrolase [Luteibacter aegosomatis]|uniref:alpha/beta fold hydrolase n=1 Tax=Luteibacter aegosomatis TaxID=2911537 RepID=UPI001FF856F3|nr:alpha/beta hydrolase [Luteibacter aegosomatis]UPG84355.1 alpha/beta hydrolase [Luteibacter aegosomatis]